MVPYTKRIFDVQTHAILPENYSRISGGIKKNASLTESTKFIMIDQIFKLLADDLKSPERQSLLGQENIHLVSINTFFPPFPPAQLIEITNRLNAWMSEASSASSHLLGIASIPPPPALAQAGYDFVKQGLEVFRRAIVDHHLKGVLFASNYDNMFLGDPVFDPYFQLADELAVPIIIHPAVQPVEEQFIPRKNIGALSGFLNDQRTTLVDLVLAGVLEKYPNLKIIATHLGGGILTSLGRFDVVQKLFPAESWYTATDGSRCLLPHPIETYLKRIYYDCNNAEVSDIVHAVSKIGKDHLLTGTDFPFADDKYTRAVLGDLQDPELADGIAYNNAARLFSNCLR